MKNKKHLPMMGVGPIYGAASIMLSGCNEGSGEISDPLEPAATEKSDSTLSRIDMAKWQYNSENNVYWQVGISYCASPDDTNYETMGLFVPGGYLDAIGAVSGVSDAVAGSMCWCPITNLDTTDAAYEWNLGVTRTDLSEEEQTISDELAAAYAEYINSLGLVTADGVALTLEKSKEGIYQSGTYYEYIKETIEDSLNNFLSDTTFPYTASAAKSGRMGGGRRGKIGNGDLPDDIKDGDIPGDIKDGDMPDDIKDGNIPDDLKNGGKGDFKDGRMNNGDDISGDMPERENEMYDRDGIGRDTAGSSGMSLDGTYDTAKDYIAALNENTTWVKYDSKTNTATITSVADFVKALKNASKKIGAFDQLDGGQRENTLFGYGDGKGAHFDAMLAKLVEAERTGDADSNFIEWVNECTTT